MIQLSQFKLIKETNLNSIFDFFDQEKIEILSMRNETNRLEELFLNLLIMTAKEQVRALFILLRKEFIDFLNLESNFDSFSFNYDPIFSDLRNIHW